MLSFLRFRSSDGDSHMLWPSDRGSWVWTGWLCFWTEGLVFPGWLPVLGGVFIGCFFLCWTRFGLWELGDLSGPFGNVVDPDTIGEE